MTIQIDTREKARAIKKIVAEFERQNIKHYSSKLYVGDYMSLDNPRLIIDRKQNLSEVCSNVCQGHERFRSELIRAKDNGIKLIILIEHSNQIKSVEDVEKWVNPRIKKRVWVPDQLKTNDKGEEYWKVGHYQTEKTKAMTGKTLSKIMQTMASKYGCEWQFCDKINTGKRIIEILGDAGD